MVGVGGCSSHIDWVGVVVGGVKTSFCTSLILAQWEIYSPSMFLSLLSRLEPFVTINFVVEQFISIPYGSQNSVMIFNFSTALYLLVAK